MPADARCHIDLGFRISRGTQALFSADTGHKHDTRPRPEPEPRVAVDRYLTVVEPLQLDLDVEERVERLDRRVLLVRELDLELRRRARVEDTAGRRRREASVRKRRGVAG